MKKTLTFKCFALGVLVAMLLCACSGAADYMYTFDYEALEAVNKVQVNDANAEQNKEYASNDHFTLFVDEQNATFKIVDKRNPNNVWSSAPLEKAPTVNGYADVYKDNGAMALIRVNYSNQLGPATSAINSYNNSVSEGTASVSQLKNKAGSVVGARFDFNFDRYGFQIPVQVLLHPQGFELSLINTDIKENMEGFGVTSVDMAPYFMSPSQADNGYFLLPDGEGALADWNDCSNPGVKYRNFVYGRDNAITNYEQKTLTEDIRLPVFGGQYKQADQVFTDRQSVATDEFGTTVALGAATFNFNRIGYTAIITEGAARAAINADLSMNYKSAYTEFIYRDIARVRVENSSKLEYFVERSNTQIPVQTVRFALMVDEKLNYVDMADAYREYLLNEAGVKVQSKANSAPMVVELFGGLMKQQFVMGFPVDKVVPLTSYEDAGNIVKELKAAGVDELVINYTQWQKDGTGAAIQDTAQAEGELGGEKALKQFIELCNNEKIAVYLDLNTNRMAKSAWGYDTGNDSTSTVRWDPAIQYYYNPNTGFPDMLTSTFLLAPTKLVDTATKLSSSVNKFNVTGVSSTMLGSDLYSDFAKVPYTRDHTEYFWNDALKIMAQTKGNLLLTGGNAYALDDATIITDAPMDYSKQHCLSERVPFYQIVLHGVVPLSTPAINQSQDVRETFLWAIETGSCLKWNWTAQNQDELVESTFNHMTGSDYEKWMEEAASQYKEASALLKKIATYQVAVHEKINADVVRVVWTDGSNEVEVYVNYGDTPYFVDTYTVVSAQSFRVF